MNNYIWSFLKTEKGDKLKQDNNRVVGRLGEMYAMIEFIYHGFEIYSPEIDSNGIDFIAQKGDIKYEVQVKSVLPKSYTYIKKDKFKNSKEFIVCYIRFIDGEPPKIYIIPAINITSNKYSDLFADYTSRKNGPEYGIKYNNSITIEVFNSDDFFS